MADHGTATRTQFLRGLRLAVIVIAVVVLGTASIFRNLPLYEPAWQQLLAWAVFAAVVVTEAVLVRRRRPWPATVRWVVLPLAFAAYATAIASLPDGAMITSVDWAFGTAGWIYLVLVLDRPLPWLGAVLVAHEAVTVVALAASGPVGTDVWLNLVSGSLGALGYPFAAGIAATALRAVSTAADAAIAEAADARTREEIEARLHDHRRGKFSDLWERAMPLLQGFADDTIDPADPGVRRRCAVEAARMRRLFAESDTVPDRLLHEIRHAVDVADRRGVLVEIESRGTWPDPPDTVRRQLTELPVLAVTTARSRARVTVIGIGDTVAVSVLADCDPVDVPDVPTSGMTHRSVLDGDSLWVETTWTPTAGTPTAGTPTPADPAFLPHPPTA